MQNQKELLTAGQLSAELKIPLQTIYTLTRQDTLPHYRFGRSVRYDLTEVLDASRGSTPGGSQQDVPASRRPTGSRPTSSLRAAELRGRAQRLERAGLAVAR